MDNSLDNLQNSRLYPLLNQLIKNLDNQNAVGNTKVIISEFIDVICCADSTDVLELNSCAVFLSQSLSQQKLDSLEDVHCERLLNWLQTSSLKCTDDLTLCNVLAAIGSLLKCRPQFTDLYWERLFHKDHSNLLKYLERKHNSRKEEVVIAIVHCLDVISSSLVEAQLTDQQIELCVDAANAVLDLHFNAEPVCTDSNHVTTFLLSSLTFIARIITISPNFTHNRVSELFGLGKAYIQWGIDVNASIPVPQKVLASQQASYDSAEEVDNNSKTRSCGGKMLKTRKPRAMVKARQQNNGQDQRLAVPQLMPIFDIKTSDSDASDPEIGIKRPLQERHRRAKVRLASISLIGVISRVLKRRVLYGYWHALFPNYLGDAHENLLSVAQRDPNVRCRSTAIQVASQLIFGSKDFLNQAEGDRKRCPTNFLPFSQSLGLIILATYKAFTNILVAESSLPVLTQALKCLAVLVQATPFHRFETKFVNDFVHQVRQLVNHRDSTVQVSALMVMEFLLATTELTPEIIEAVGLPRAHNTAVARNHFNNESEELIEDGNFDEFVESDEEVGGSEKSNQSARVSVQTGQMEESCWLLLRILRNLTPDEIKGRVRVPATVLIESLQVLSAMAAHNSLLTPHLEKVAFALENALQDPSSDVRLYAARCTDSCAYYISRQLLDKTISASFEIEVFDKFWQKMLPAIMNQIRSADELANHKISLCDALSNIGSGIFEHLCNGAQLNILSFLSGVGSDTNEETTVRAAAVRALAVFVLFPSLRHDLVFIENVAELTLRLVTDPNLLVRVKALWSMGNVSDALVNNSINANPERISDILLQSLVQVATDACKDNDKVRCNAVRTLGNLLRLLNEQQLGDAKWRDMTEKSVSKLINCIRSGGSAKVKWNTCYAIGNLMRNKALFIADLDWQTPLYSALCHIIVHHSNFKVRINATAVILHIEERSYFGTHFEMFWSAVLAAIEQSYNLDNFYEYNHRDNLQEQLCLAVCHIVSSAQNDDFPMLKKHLTERSEVVRNTWIRVTNRVVPEKVAPMSACAVLLQERIKSEMPAEQKSAIGFIAQALAMS